jgi:hypothetical protein
VEPSPSVESDRNRVDLYGYLSMTVAAVQTQQTQIERQQAQIEALQAQIRELQRSADSRAQ